MWTVRMSLKAFVVLTTFCLSLAGYAIAAENCLNQIDDDRDRRIDCDDPDCQGLWICRPFREICANGIDDNRNGYMDCDEKSCQRTSVCMRRDESCANGLDDDGDGTIDCDDDDCAETFICLPYLEQCEKPGDEDGDGLVNCEDDDCKYAPACNLTEDSLIFKDITTRQVQRLPRPGPTTRRTPPSGTIDRGGLITPNLPSEIKRPTEKDPNTETPK
ncbi:MAG: hypothetical protein AAGH90_09120 [Pseudomonadota bacterium]